MQDKAHRDLSNGNLTFISQQPSNGTLKRLPKMAAAAR